MATEAETLLADTGWLPEPLRTSGNRSADAVPTGAGGEQTTVEGGETAMGDQMTSDENELADHVSHAIAAE